MGEALTAAACTTAPRWLFSRRLTSAGRLATQRGLPNPVLFHAWRDPVASALEGSIALVDGPSRKHLPANTGFIHSRQFSGTPAVLSRNLSEPKRGGDSAESTDKICGSPFFVHVNDRSNHWLPCLAAKAALQGQGQPLYNVFGAAKGDCTSADPSRLQQKATAATTRSGWVIPRVAVVVFHAEWSASSADLQRWLATALASKAQDEASLELISVSSDSSPRLTKLYNVTSIPHCVLLLRGCLALELPAAASDGRRASFVATVAEAASPPLAHALPRVSPRNHKACHEQFLIATNVTLLSGVFALWQELLQKLLTISVPHAARPLLSPALKQRVKGSQLLLRIPMKSSDGKKNEAPGSYVFDVDERASRVAALGTVALFDAPGVATEDLRALEEALVLRLGGSAGNSSKEAQPKESAQLSESVHATLSRILECEEPQWSIDDCPTIRSLPLFNQLTLNANLFSKARGARPPRRPKEAVSSSAAESADVPYWQLSGWLARARRCLAARLFLESAEDAALSLAAKSHEEWLAAASACNFMRLRLERREACTVVEGSQFVRAEMHEVGNSGEKARHGAAVHPLDVFSEPRAPSPGRALLSSMYTALGPDDSRIYHGFADLQVAMTTAGFHPTKFSHTRARRGGKPRMTRGRSGRWFWLGPYWKPPWGPRKRPLAESWHLSNATA
ncbi:hypothetical protein Esti_004575 [Eimeria stiedai]